MQWSNCRVVTESPTTSPRAAEGSVPGEAVYRPSVGCANAPTADSGSGADRTGAMGFVSIEEGRDSSFSPGPSVEVAIPPLWL
jgi:hypothetical protein